MSGEFPSIEIEVTQQIVEIEVEPQSTSIEVATTGLRGEKGDPGTGAGADLSIEYQARLGQFIDYPNCVKQLLYTNGRLATIRFWNNNTKTILLMKKDLNYDGSGKLISLTITVQNNSPIVKPLTYTNGLLTEF